MEIVIMTPDWVVSVMYHMIAYWTRDDPNSDIVWPTKKSVMFFFQFGFMVGAFSIR
jgi:hypothetical protein